MKRYWINNSDDEVDDEDVDTTRVMVKLGDSQVLKKDFPDIYDPDLKGRMKDEFFPVQVCRQRRYVKVQDPTQTFMHDKLEYLPTHCVLESRMQTEVQYDGKQPKTDTSTASNKLLAGRSFGNDFIKQRVFL